MPTPRRPLAPARRKLRARWWLEYLEDRTLPSTLAGAHPRLSFQAVAAGDYFLGVSGHGDGDYDPNADASGSPALTAGRFALDLTRAAGARAAADPLVTRAMLAVPAAAWGETVP